MATSKSQQNRDYGSAARRSRKEKPYAILLAEDDDEMRSLLIRVLAKEGYRVEECTNGVELLQHFGSFTDEEQSASFDLIVSDIRMPGFTGMEILDFVHDNSGFPPIMLITAFGDAKTHAEAESLGVAAMLDKPFDLDVFQEIVAQILESNVSAKAAKKATAKVISQRHGFPLDVIFRNSPRLMYIEEHIFKEAEKLTRLNQKIIFCRVIIENHITTDGSELYYSRLILTLPGKVFVITSDNHDDAPSAGLKTDLTLLFDIAEGKIKKYLEAAEMNVRRKAG